MKLKMFFSLFILGLTIMGCSSTETKIEDAALEYVEEIYNITDAEVVSVKPVEDEPVAFLVVLMSRIFGGLDYDVEVEMNDSVSTITTGTVNNRELEFRNVDYEFDKHEALLEKSDEYQKEIDTLLEKGVVINKVTSGVGIDPELYEDGFRLLTYDLEVKDLSFDSEDIVERLQTLSDHILEEVDPAIEMELELPVRTYDEDEFQNDSVEVELSYESEKALIDKLSERTSIAQLGDQFEEVSEKETTFSVELSRSSFGESYEAGEDHHLEHTLTLLAVEGFVDENILDVMEWLRDEGFSQSYVLFMFSDGITNTCQAKEIKTKEDIEQCYGIVTKF